MLVAELACRILVREQTDLAQCRLAVDRPFPNDGNDPLLVVLVGVRVVDLVRIRADQVETAETDLLAVDLECCLVRRSGGTVMCTGT